jgi:hypothetical protein
MKYSEISDSVNNEAIHFHKKHRYTSGESLENFSDILDKTFEHEEPEFRTNSEYENGLLMKIEDLRSFYLRSTPTDLFSIAMTEYYDRHINAEEANSMLNKTLHRQDAFFSDLDQNDDSCRAKSITVRNEFELLDQLETQYKSQIDQSYQSSNYKAMLANILADEISEEVMRKTKDYKETIELMSELQEKMRSEFYASNKKNLKNIKKLKEENEKLKSVIVELKLEIEKVKNETEVDRTSLIEEKRKFRELSAKLKQEMSEVVKIAEERKKQYDAFLLQKNKFEEDKSRFEATVADSEGRKTTSSAQLSPRSPFLSYNTTRSQEIDYVEVLKRYLSIKSPTETAIAIIEDIQLEVKAYEDFKEFTHFRIPNRILQSREEAITLRLTSETKAIQCQQKEIEKWFKFIDKYKRTDSESVKQSISFQALRYERQLYESQNAQLRLMLTAIHALQLELTNSIELYKDSFANLLGIFNAIEQKKQVLSELAVLIRGSTR